MRLIRIDPLTDKIYLRVKTNFYPYVPNFLTELGEIRYTICPRNYVQNLWIFLKFGLMKAILHWSA